MQVLYWRTVYMQWEVMLQCKEKIKTRSSCQGSQATLTYYHTVVLHTHGVCALKSSGFRMSSLPPWWSGCGLMAWPHSLLWSVGLNTKLLYQWGLQFQLQFGGTPKPQLQCTFPWYQPQWPPLVASGLRNRSTEPLSWHKAAQTLFKLTSHTNYPVP